MALEKKLSLVVMMPALNEEATLPEVLSKIPREIPGIGLVRAVVIDDGSTDDTARIAAENGAEVISFGYNRGLGAAFSAGLIASLRLGADIIVNIDADGQFDPGDIPKLVAPIVAGQADMTTASRFADKELIPQMPWLKKWGNRRFARLLTHLTGLKMHDVSCGFRAYSRDSALRATLLGRHTYTHEVILDLAFRGERILEVPVRVIGVRKHGRSRVAGSLWKYGWRSLGIILQSYRDYRPMPVFGGISVVFFLIAMALGAFVIVHYAIAGKFWPYTFVGFLAGGFGFISLVSFVTALLAGMLTRVRIQQDEQLYLLRKREYESADGPEDSA